MHIVVGVNDHIGVALVADDGCKKRVVEQGHNGTGANVWLNHGVVDLGLVEETTELVIVVLPNDVHVVLAVNVESGPIPVLRAT